MITYAVCIHRRELYERVCLPALKLQRDRYGAEIVEVVSTLGLSYAYEVARNGAGGANHDTVVYLHDDVELLDEDATPRILGILDDSSAGLMGVVGSAPGETVIPWWRANRTEGAWIRPTRCAGDKMLVGLGDVISEKRWRPGDRWERGPYRPAQMLDGILLADRTNLPWIERETWHGYDHERCLQVAAAGHEIVVGDLLVRHHSGGHTNEWHEAMEATWEMLREEWAP